MAGKLSLGGILAPTEPVAANGELGDDQADDVNGQSRGALRASRPPRPRKGRKPGEKLRGCKLSIPEQVFDRLEQYAIKKKITLSEAAGTILDKQLPYFQVVQSDKPPAGD